MEDPNPPPKKKPTWLVLPQELEAYQSIWPTTPLFFVEQLAKKKKKYPIIVGKPWVCSTEGKLELPRLGLFPSLQQYHNSLHVWPRTKPTEDSHSSEGEKAAGLQRSREESKYQASCSESKQRAWSGHEDIQKVLVSVGSHWEVWTGVIWTKTML